MSAKKQSPKKTPATQPKTQAAKSAAKPKPEPKPNYLTTITDEDEALSLAERKGFYTDESLMRKDCVVQGVDFVDGKLQNVRILVYDCGDWSKDPIVVNSDKFDSITLV